MKNFLRIVFAVLVFLAVSFGISGCSKESVPADADTHFEISLGGKSVSVRLALTDLERSRGLMHCKKLDENEGMIFVYQTEDSRSFWMMNVPINLSIGYFDSAGRLLETHEMKAHDLTSVRSDSDCVLYCLEMREGWFRENGIVPGAQIDLDALKKAMRSRGFTR